jgi:hypothetical protein
VVRPGAEVCFFSSDSAETVSSDPAVLSARYEALGLQPAVLKYAFELSEFPPDRVAAVTDVLERALPSAAVDTDARPVLFSLYLEIEAQFAGGYSGGSRTLSGRIRDAGAAPLVGGLVVFGVFLAAVRWRRGRAGSAVWFASSSVCTTGVFGLAAAMLIVYGYQTAFGYVYRDVSVIAGLFMVGLACGGWLAARTGPGGSPAVLAALDAAQAAFVIALSWVAVHAAFSPLAFMALSAGAGFITGAVFPSAARLALASGAAPGRVAGLLDAADHAGATLGAASAGLLLIPALGLPATALLLAGLKCVSAAGMLSLSVGGSDRPA